MANVALRRADAEAVARSRTVAPEVSLRSQNRNRVVPDLVPD